MKYFLNGALIIVMLSSCRPQFHPNEIRPDQTNLNTVNIRKLSEGDIRENFKFILIGDTQRFYDQLDDFITHVNSLTDISFVLVSGDLVDFGLNREFNWIASRLNKLRVPYIACIGNHDMLANGRAIFNQMFGPENFTFDFGKNKFICLNTNSKEGKANEKIPDLTWLAQELKDSTPSKVFMVSHISPASLDFDRELASEYSLMISSNPRVRISMHGHDHNFKLWQPYGDSLDYLHVGTIGKRNYALINVTSKNFSIKEEFY